MTTRTALITGVSRPLGLGFAVARQLAELDHHVILTARNAGQAEQLAARLRQDHLPATALRLDLAASLRAPAHSLAKYLLGVLTAKLATELRDTPILVNAVDPGETATHPERGDENTARPAADSARGVVWAATLPADGPTGGFFRDGHPLT